MSYYLLNSYCSPKPYTVVETVKPIEAGLIITQTQNSKPVTTQSPEIFGPAFWFSLHTGAAYLPEVLSPISANRIKGLLTAYPKWCLVLSVPSMHVLI